MQLNCQSDVRGLKKERESLGHCSVTAFPDGDDFSVLLAPRATHLGCSFLIVAESLRYLCNPHQYTTTVN
jgi:hypothetical protein